MALEVTSGSPSIEILCFCTQCRFGIFVFRMNLMEKYFYQAATLFYLGLFFIFAAFPLILSKNH